MDLTIPLLFIFETSLCAEENLLPGHRALEAAPNVRLLIQLFLCAYLVYFPLFFKVILYIGFYHSTWLRPIITVFSIRVTIFRSR